jgi:hypothetical protein
VGRDSEVLWAIWLLKELEEKLPRASTDLMLANCGPLVLCLLPHFSRHRLTSDRRIKNKLWDLVEGNPHAGEHWPITLEMTHLRMENVAWDAFDTPEPLRILHDQRRTIVRWNALPKVFEDDGPEPDDGDGEPKYAIENYGDDYGDYDDYDDEEDGDALGEPVGDPVDLDVTARFRKLGFPPFSPRDPEDDLPL